MKFSLSAFCSLAALATVTRAVNMTNYAPSPGVEERFKEFVRFFYYTSESRSSAVSYKSFWPEDGRMILAGHQFNGTAAILAAKQRLLPPGGDKRWWHLIRGAVVKGETVADKTYAVDVVIQTTYLGGNCSEAYGNAAFTILKDDTGLPRLEAYSQSLSLYNLTVTPTFSPTSFPCTS
ncbi:hypothetical protein QTJ16_005416 [Diplocarpon rosae]|uniref:SnoaL-like domain-containing protein n=1 Tax=Diplocarpon rosae TaxID=946125 RepID=A0AAD9SWY2_9HELO|nr:hypothetical protein QTJ16_005416 [Diplocarpon rosae]